MKNATKLLGLLFLIHSGLAFSQWQIVGNTPNTAIYAEHSSVQKSGGNARMLILFDYKLAKSHSSGATYLSAVVQVEFDCRGRQRRFLKTASYSESMGDGEVVETHALPNIWETVTPNGSAEEMWRIACKP